MRHISLPLAIIISITLSSVVMAAKEKKAAGTGPNPYRECGIGAAIFTDNGTAAAISNIIWDIGTTAITSATASPETCNAKQVAAATFILETQENVYAEAAQGSGEHLDALRNILDVNELEWQKVVAQVRSDMTVYVKSSDYENSNQVEKAEQFYNSVVTAINS